jgi:hypothetical protein
MRKLINALGDLDGKAIFYIVFIGTAVAGFGYAFFAWM